MIKIQHNSRFSTAYLHLSKLAPGISAGKRVSRGDVIGAVGATGLATGPHLHFSLFDNGRYIDPLKNKLPQMLDQKDRIAPVYLQTMLKTLRREHESVQIALAGKKGGRRV